MDTAGQDKHLFILESYRAEAPRAEKIDSGMYMSALNTTGVSDQGGGVTGGEERGGLRVSQPQSKMLGFS